MIVKQGCEVKEIGDGALGKSSVEGEEREHHWR